MTQRFDRRLSDAEDGFTVQDFELWWLLIFPVFFGLGRLAARWTCARCWARRSMCRPLYFTGLQALVDDELIRAAAALAEAVRHQPRAAEGLQVALARLYCKRGEHDLAIRQLTACCKTTPMT